MKKNFMKKEICIVVGIGAILVVISILFIVVLRDKIAGIALPEASKNYYIQYIVKTPEGEIIPTTIDYVTNNGKLFSFSYSMSAVITSTIFLFFGRWIYKMIFNKGVQVDLTRILRMIEIVVLILGIFTFTSKINPDNNIEKYMIQSDVSDYLEQTDYSSGDVQKIIGYVKKVDIQGENKLLAVYESPELESAPIEEGNRKDEMNRDLIRNIGKINVWAETATIIIGVYVFVLKDYQKRYDDIYAKNRSQNSKEV